MSFRTLEFLAAFVLFTLSACGGPPDQGAGGDGGVDVARCRPACGPGTFCVADDVCEPLRANAAGCASDEACLSQRCESGVCCAPGQDCCVVDADCTGAYRCDLAAHVCIATCTVATESSACKPEAHCTDGGHCVPDLGAGQGAGCDRDAMCAGNQRCIDGFCCDTPCEGCFACNLPGSEGTCRAVGAGLDPHDACLLDHCASDGTCDGEGACRPVAAGVAPIGGCPAVACQLGLCDGAGSCLYEAVEDGTSCGAGNACGGAVCSAGACEPPCALEGTACAYCALDRAFYCGGC